MNQRPQRPRPPQAQLFWPGPCHPLPGSLQKFAIPAYLYLFIATAAMLMVPQMVQNIIDALTNGYLAQQAFQDPGRFPGPGAALALQKLAGRPSSIPKPQRAESAIIIAGLLIVLFAVASGLFTYGQTYMSERTSQSVAFDFRNDLYAKIQRLSFSYHEPQPDRPADDPRHRRR